jgi:hypothetical protein
MFEEQHLIDRVSVRAADGDEFELPVLWHLCADLKMVSLVTGLGGASVTNHASHVIGTAASLLGRVRLRPMRGLVYTRHGPPSTSSP